MTLWAPLEEDEPPRFRAVYAAQVAISASFKTTLYSYIFNRGSRPGAEHLPPGPVQHGTSPVCRSTTRILIDNGELHGELHRAQAETVVRGSRKPDPSLQLWMRVGSDIFINKVGRRKSYEEQRTEILLRDQTERFL